MVVVRSQNLDLAAAAFQCCRLPPPTPWGPKGCLWKWYTHFSATFYTMSNLLGRFISCDLQTVLINHRYRYYVLVRLKAWASRFCSQVCCGDMQAVQSSLWRPALSPGSLASALHTGRCCLLAYQLFLLLLTMSDVFSSLGSCPHRREETALPLGIPTWLPVSSGTE